MTGKELIKWIEDNHAEDYEIEIVYRDDGGYYYGSDDTLELEIVKAGQYSNSVDPKYHDRILL